MSQSDADAANQALTRLMSEMAEDAGRVATRLRALQNHLDREPEDEAADAEERRTWQEWKETKVYGRSRSTLFRYPLSGGGRTVVLEVRADRRGWGDYIVMDVRLMGSAGYGPRVLTIEDDQGMWALAQRLVNEED